MNGTKIMVDTNVIIYHLAGNKNIETFLNETLIYISAITYSELLSSSKLSVTEEKTLKEYLQSVQIVHTNNFICEITSQIRKKFKLKLPDALVTATCFYLDVPLITFDKVDDLKIIKFSL